MNSTLQTPGPRIVYLDSLRTFLVFLVIVLHAALVYESGGFASTWWVVTDRATSDAASVAVFLIDVFVMPAIFFIAGFFTPKSLAKNGGVSFAVNKAKRLMIPWAVAVLTLMPMYKFIFLYSRSMPQDRWTNYFYWNNGIFGQAWLWFLPVLFIVGILYIPLSKIRIQMHPALAIAAAVSVCIANSLIMETFGLTGWTKNAFVNFQNERIVTYIVYFLLGAYAFNTGLLERIFKHRKIFLISAPFAPLLLGAYIFLFLFRIFHPASLIISPEADGLLLHILFHGGLAGILYFLIGIFKFFPLPKTAEKLNPNTYGVYIIHNVILGIFALMMLHLNIRGTLKFMLLSLATFTVSHAMVWAYRRGKSRVLKTAG